jgi:hypothetical protein
VTLLSGRETLEVVGESHHPDEVWAIVGGRTTEPVRLGGAAYGEYVHIQRPDAPAEQHSS